MNARVPHLDPTLVQATISLAVVQAYLQDVRREANQLRLNPESQYHREQLHKAYGALVGFLVAAYAMSPAIELAYHEAFFLTHRYQWDHA